MPYTDESFRIFFNDNLPGDLIIRSDGTPTMAVVNNELPLGIARPLSLRDDTVEIPTSNSGALSKKKVVRANIPTNTTHTNTTTANWYNKYKNNKGLFNISRADLEKWANLFGDETTKNYIKNWTGKSDKELWRDSNSGMAQTFKNFTNWVKNNGGEQSKIGSMDLSMSNSNFTYDKNNWTFNKGTIGLVQQTSGTINPYKSYNPAEPLNNVLNSILSTKIETPQVSPNMNRRQTRDYMRSKGLNPYSYSGDERRALRLYMNGDTSGSGYDINLLKNSDLGNKLNLKFQQGGKMNEHQLLQAFLQYLMLKTGAQNELQLEQVIQLMGQEGVKQAYAQFIQAMLQQQVQAAKFGAKLNYIKRLNGQCPEGEYLQYYKVGGRLCKKCMKAAELEAKSDPIKEFKCGKKIRKHATGGAFQQAFNKARSLKHRYFWYKGKTYNTMNKGENREQWAKNFIDNSTSGGSDRVQTDVGYSGGWQGVKGANVGRYDSHGNWIRPKAPAKNAVVGARGDSVRNSDYKTFTPIDKPTDTVVVNGRGTDRGVQRTNKTKGYSVGNIPVADPSIYNHYGSTTTVKFLPGGYPSNGGSYVTTPITPWPWL